MSLTVAQNSAPQVSCSAKTARLGFLDALLDHKVIVFNAADVLTLLEAEDENELILDTVLDGVTGPHLFCWAASPANNILEHLDVAMLTVDETVDDGDYL